LFTPLNRLIDYARPKQNIIIGCGAKMRTFADSDIGSRAIANNDKLIPKLSDFSLPERLAVIPAQTGIQKDLDSRWMPAFAVLTERCSRSSQFW